MPRVACGRQPRYAVQSNPSGALPGPIAAAGRSFSVSFRASLAGTPPASPSGGAPLPSWIR